MLSNSNILVSNIIALTVNEEQSQAIIQQQCNCPHPLVCVISAVCYPELFECCDFSDPDLPTCSCER